MRKYTFAVFAMLLCFTILVNPVASAVAATKTNVILNGKNINSLRRINICAKNLHFLNVL